MLHRGLDYNIVCYATQIAPDKPAGGVQTNRLEVIEWLYLRNE